MLPALDERDRRHVVVDVVTVDVAKLFDFACFGVPQVDRLCKGNRQNIVRPPVNQVEVVVVEDVRSVENLLWFGGNVTVLMTALLTSTGTLGVQHTQAVLIALFLRGCLVRKRQDFGVCKIIARFVLHAAAAAARRHVVTVLEQ